MFVAAIAVGSTGYIGAQSKIEPYVIGVKNGEEVVGVASVQKLPTSQLEALKVNDLERFVEDIRSVYLDVEVEDKAVRRAYARLVPNSPAQTQISQAFKEENPFERAARSWSKSTSRAPCHCQTTPGKWSGSKPSLTAKATYSIRRALKPPSPPKPSNPKTKRR
ncbi:VirB8/TrbF family protein [Vibrio parahaemolyticus]|nr:VirB8/TrbF family protein [Vibrio parahaemolyticus]